MVGHFSGDAVTSGADNAGFGQSALGGLTTGVYNVGIGRAANLAMTTNSYTVAVGGNTRFRHSNLPVVASMQAMIPSSKP